VVCVMYTVWSTHSMVSIRNMYLSDGLVELRDQTFNRVNQVPDPTINLLFTTKIECKSLTNKL
jgi:hypothetical protein